MELRKFPEIRSVCPFPERSSFWWISNIWRKYRFLNLCNVHWHSFWLILVIKLGANILFLPNICKYNIYYPLFSISKCVQGRTSNKRPELKRISKMHAISLSFIHYCSRVSYWKSIMYCIVLGNPLWHCCSDRDMYI